MKKILLIFLLGILLIVGCGKTQDTTQTQDTRTQGNIIEITSDIFSPNELRINAGDTVTWVSKDTKDSWPASAVHPTHEKYPGSGITKCGTNEEQNIFDACKGLKPGESWSFTFTQKGTWGYHEHLNLGRTGKIIVE